MNTWDNWGEWHTPRVIPRPFSKLYSVILSMWSSCAVGCNGELVCGERFSKQLSPRRERWELPDYNGSKTCSYSLKQKSCKNQSPASRI